MVSLFLCVPLHDYKLGGASPLRFYLQLCAHYGVKKINYSSSLIGLSIYDTYIWRGDTNPIPSIENCKFEQRPSFGQVNSLREMLDLAKVLGIFSEFYDINERCEKIYNHNYSLLKNIANGYDAFPIVYPPVFIEL